MDKETGPKIENTKGKQNNKSNVFKLLFYESVIEFYVINVPVTVKIQ